MKRMNLLIALLALLTLALAACGSEDSTTIGPPSNDDYDPNWDTVAPTSDGKADVIDLATALKFGETLEGSVNQTQVVLYKITLERGDGFTMVMNTTSGDLSPDFILFENSRDAIRSKTFDVNKTTLTKGYEIETSGTYLITVRAFRNRGSGSYKLTATCDAGPCNGDVVEPEVIELDTSDLLECVSEISDCALKSVRDQAPGDVDPEIVNLVWSECTLSAAQSLGFSCDAACDEADFDSLCFEWQEALPFFGDSGNDCIDAFDVCFEECLDFGADGSGFSDDVADDPQFQCLFLGFNGNCLGYASDLAVCGGKVELDTPAECHTRCQSSIGAIIDDLDLICVEGCEECDAECVETLDSL